MALMFAEFAVEPSIFKSKSHVNQYLPHLGPHCGRLIGAVPPSWVLEAEKALRSLNLPPVEASAAYEYLNYVSNGVVTRPKASWRDHLPWIENVLAENIRLPFRAVLSESECSAPNLLKAGSLHGTDSIWQVPSSKRIPKCVRDITGCVAPILGISSTVLIIDPYFSPLKKGFVDSVSSIVAAACSRGRIPKFNLYAELRIAGQIKNKYDFFCATDKVLSPRLPSAVKIELFLLNAQRDGDEFHDRYIVTEKGGVFVSYGIDGRENRNITTQVGRLTAIEVKELFRDYYYEHTRKYDVLSDFPKLIESRKSTPIMVSRIAANKSRR